MVPTDEGLRWFPYEALARYVHELKQQFLCWISSTGPSHRGWMYWEPQVREQDRLERGIRSFPFYV